MVLRSPGIINEVTDTLSCTHQIQQNRNFPEGSSRVSGESSRGPAQIDLFKTLNRKVPTFVSVFGHSDSLAVDAFTVDWNMWDQYNFPPHKLFPAVVEKL